MTTENTAVLAAFDAEARRFASQLAALSPTHLALPTRCAPWNAKTLAAHVVRGAERAAAMLADPVALLADPDPLVYYRSPLRSDPARSLTRNTAATESAARFDSAQVMAAALDDVVDRVERGYATLPESVCLQTHWGPVMRADDYLATRVVEVAVHGLDLADALEVESWLTDEAATVVADLLRRLIGWSDGSRTAWSPEEFVRIGTGRRELTAAERNRLGASASRFPLIR